MGPVTQHTTLVTGATGFTGRHLIAHLQGRRQRIIGSVRNPTEGFVTCDVTRRDDLRAVLAKHRPDEVVHCAGTFANAWEPDFNTNALAAKHLLDVVAELGIDCRILLIGSAAEYGWPEPGAVAEIAPLRPVSVYGLTKIMQTQIMGFAHRLQHVNVVMARTFNLLGEGCSPSLFPGRVQQQIAELKAGRTDHITVGPLGSQRDYLPVAEAVAAYERILVHGQSGEVYNVGSGRPTPLTDVLAGLLQPHGLSMAHVRVAPLPGQPRANVEVVYADISKLRTLSHT